MKEFGHKSSSSSRPPPPQKKKKVVVVAGVGGPIGEKDKWPNSFIKVVLGKETTFITNFLHISCPGEKDYFYDKFPSKIFSSEVCLQFFSSNIFFSRKLFFPVFFSIIFFPQVFLHIFSSNSFSPAVSLQFLFLKVFFLEVFLQIFSSNIVLEISPQMFSSNIFSPDVSLQFVLEEFSPEVFLHIFSFSAFAFAFAASASASAFAFAAFASCFCYFCCFLLVCLSLCGHLCTLCA